MQAYAADAPWFVAYEPIVFQGNRYVSYGPALTVSPHEVRAVGTHRGIPLYAEAEPGAEQGVLLVPVRPGCVFQPYYRGEGGAAVRP